MERRHHRESLPSGREPGVLTSGDRGGFPSQDPRQFKFAIICKKCDLKYATMQKARIHFQGCPFGKPIDVMCGHCELRTSLWPAMCVHLNQPGMQKQVACKPEYRTSPMQRVEFTQGIQPLLSPASPRGMAELEHSECASPGSMEWKTPAPLTLSPSRREARSERLAQLRAILLHWERKHPGRTGLRGTGAILPIIPLEPAPGRGYRLPAAAGSARDLAPASPDPQDAYSPPLEEEGAWASAEPAEPQPIVGRVSPQVVQQPLLPPTEGATSLEYEALYGLTFPDSLLGVVKPPVDPLLPRGDAGMLGQALEGMETPPSTLSGRRKRNEPLRTCDILEEAATVSRILQGPELSDILQSPLSAFSPPTVVPQVKSEPDEVIEVPDSPPRKCASPVGAPIDYKRAYEDLQQRFRGHMTQLHFWAEIVGGLGIEGTRLPTPEEQARRRQLIELGYWPAWMNDTVNMPLSAIGERFRVYYGALLHEGGPRF